ncbi:F-box protein [Cucumis melo var. makuwa]|uniref:F-box protein n=1 Tax=Cucumis melo var. makuwa TaxID=1194695 RepID=A0A5D3C070_CUCMM|nr:F-box protein [Cucumis melo var. makuwa]
MWLCRKWKEGVKLSLGRRNSLSFAGWKMDDNSTTRLIRHAYREQPLVFSRKKRWLLQQLSKKSRKPSSQLEYVENNLKNIKFLMVIGLKSCLLPTILSRLYVSRSELAMDQLYLKNPEVLDKVGIKPPHGVLSKGPPGYGKVSFTPSRSGNI